MLPRFRIEPPPGGVENISELITVLVTWSVAFGALAALVGLLRGGFQYITAGSDADQAEGARKTIVNSVTGLIILASAFAVFNLLLDILNLGAIFPTL